MILFLIFIKNKLRKKALITGITGQDGSYLAEFLLKKNYEVHGIKRRSSSFNTSRINHIYQDPHDINCMFKLHYGDLTDSTNIIKIIKETKPDEIYNLGAQSHVAVSFESPEYTANCDALGILAEDYYKDSLDIQEQFTGMEEINLTDLQIDTIYENGFIELDSDITTNSFVIAVGDSQGKSALCIYSNNELRLISGENPDSQTDVKPRNKEQRFALHVLNNQKIPLVSLTGLAGSGKTFLALMSGLDAVLTQRYERIVITRSIQTVGKDIGYLPGDIKEKMDPWMAPLMDNFRHHFKDKTYFEMMMEKGTIEIAPLSHIRGRTFNNSYIIVDEAQNTTIHELKTIITRIGENSKIVLMGDTDQIDTPYIDKRSNGLAIVIEKLKNTELSAHIHLARGERSELATFASQVL